MARYKPIDTSPRFIAVDLERQLLPGTFEHALNHLVDHQLDLSRFDARYKNDLTGASAYAQQAEEGLRQASALAARRDRNPITEMKMARRNSRHSRRLLRLEKGFFYSFNVEVTGAARLYRAASVWTAGLGLCNMTLAMSGCYSS
jgi:hypothetical protein